MIRFAIPVAASALILLAGCESSAERQAVSGNTDALFLTEAAQGSQEEIRLGRLAVDQSTNPEVKAFAQKMIDDHRLLFGQIRDTASQMNLTVPESVTDAAERRADSLAQLQGAQFDREYINQMVAAHKRDITTFETEARAATDPRIRSLAQKALPDLRNHLQKAQNLQKSLQSPAGSAPQGSGTSGNSGASGTGASGDSGSSSGQQGASGNSGDHPSTPQAR